MKRAIDLMIRGFISVSFYIDKNKMIKEASTKYGPDTRVYR